MKIEVDKTAKIVALALIALGISLRLWIRWPTDFWEDEIIAATHAMQPLGRIAVECLRFDVHPPLYFMQLHLWALASHSDAWLTANSVAWGLAAIASLWWVTRRLYDRQVALFAAAIFAVLPSPVYMSDQLRMYAMLVFLIVWHHYFAVRNFSGVRGRTASVLTQCLLGIAIVLTHAIGFVAVLVSAVYVCVLQLKQPSAYRRLWTAFFVYGAAALAALPWLASDVLRDANIIEPGGLAVIGLTMSETVLGYIAYEVPDLRIVGAILFLGVTITGLAGRSTRAVTLVFIVLPISLCFISALLFKPFFKWNFFSTSIAPYLAIILAQALSAADAKFRLFKTDWRVAVALGCVTTLAIVCVATRVTVRVTSGYREKSEVIAANFRAGDLIYAPQFSIFEGIAWYLAGPNWGSPLDIAEQPSGAWLSLYTRLGPVMVERLGLMPKSQLLDYGGYRILAGNSSAEQTSPAARVWMVTVPRADLHPGYPPRTLNGLATQWTDRNHTSLTLYARDPQHVTVPDNKP